MQFNLKTFLDKGREPYRAEQTIDLSAEDFGGYQIAQPVAVQFYAKLVTTGVEMELSVQAEIQAECARCLQPVTEQIRFVRNWLVCEEDLASEEFELPVDAQGVLDVRELAFQEIVLDVPPVMLCTQDCSGLCLICGKPNAAGCTCGKGDDPTPTDPRLAILKQLLT